MNREPNALDALSYVEMKVCEYGAIILAAICGFWMVTP